MIGWIVALVLLVLLLVRERRAAAWRAEAMEWRTVRSEIETRDQAVHKLALERQRSAHLEARLSVAEHRLQWWQRMWRQLVEQHDLEGLIERLEALEQEGAKDVERTDKAIADELIGADFMDGGK